MKIFHFYHDFIDEEERWRLEEILTIFTKFVLEIEAIWFALEETFTKSSFLCYQIRETERKNFIIKTSEFFWILKNIYF